MRTFRALAATFTIGLLTLSACGTPTEPKDSAPTPGAIVTLGTDADTSDAVCGELKPAEGPQEIKHISGTSKVPADPQRIVILDSDKLDSMCALGLQDKVVGTIELAGGLPEYLGPTIHGLQTVGPIAEPQLEKIAALKPDLILGSKFRTPELYDQLSQIAPTVFTELVGLTWKENFLVDGAAVRRGEQAKTLLANYEANAKQLGTKVDGSTANASIVRFRAGGAIRFYGPTSFSGQVLEDAGVSRPAPQMLEGKEERRFAEISEEQINLADGSIIYVATYGADGEPTREKVMNGPLWKSLEGVKAGNVYIVKDETWMTGIGVIAADRILADLEQSLGK